METRDSPKKTGIFGARIDFDAPKIEAQNGLVNFRYTLIAFQGLSRGRAMSGTLLSAEICRILSFKRAGIVSTRGSLPTSKVGHCHCTAM